MGRERAVEEREQQRPARTQLSLYIPKQIRETGLIERLEALAKRQRRSLNFLIIEAIARYLQEEKGKGDSSIGDEE